MDNPCATPAITEMTPTELIHTGFLSRMIGPLRNLACFIRNLSRQDRPEDPKRLAVIISASALAAGFLILIGTISRLAFLGKPLDNGLLTFTAGVGVTLGGLAGYVHRKPDEVLPPGGGQ